MNDRIMELYNLQNAPLRELIKKEKYKGYEYIIVWFNGHPNAYIKIPENHPFYRKFYGDIHMDNYPHGDFTFSDANLHEDFGLDDGWYLGWDYAHGCDFQRFRDGYINEGRRYSVDEISDECKRTIEEIKCYNISFEKKEENK